MGTSNLAIETAGLVRRFDEVAAVDGIDLTIRAGETFALLGPNGAGKTTTIRMLCVLLRPTSGTVVVAGHDVHREPLEIKRAIALSPQETAIAANLDAWENLSLMARLHQIDADTTRRRSERLLAQFGLLDRADERVKRYSGGMKRRLSIAMALVSEPEVLFLDEPTLGLDPQSRRSLWDHITDLQGSITIVLTTHYLEEAEALADRVAIIDHGRIVAEGTPSQLKSDVPDGQATVVEADLDEAAVGALRRRFVSVKRTPTGAEIGDEDASLDAVLDILRPLGVTTQATYRKQVTLDDVFIHLTGRELRA